MINLFQIEVNEIASVIAIVVFLGSIIFWFWRHFGREVKSWIFDWVRCHQCNTLTRHYATQNDHILCNVCHHESMGYRWVPKVGPVWDPELDKRNKESAKEKVCIKCSAINKKRQEIIDKTLKKEK